ATIPARFSRHAHGMAIRSYRANLHRLRRAVLEFWRQSFVPGAGTQSEIEEGSRNDVAAAGARSDRPDRVPLAAARLSFHDARLNCRHRGGAGDVRTRGLSRSLGAAGGSNVDG